MATTRIPYQSQTGPGFEVADYVNAVQIANAKGRRLLAKLNSMSSGADWAAVAAEIGGITAVQAQALWTIISTGQGQIDSAAIAEYARLDQR